VTDTVVIGAGQAGLCASWFLTRHGREHVVLEAARVGESWRRRWDGFWLNTPNWTVALPGRPYSGDDPDGFMRRDETVRHLEEYAAGFDAPVREGVRVDRLADGYLLETSAGGLEARNVVVATGAFNRAHLPRLDAPLPQLHSDDYRSPSELPEGPVLVVGSGQSGCQIADELLQAGRRVYLAVGRCPWLPRRHRGKDVLHWMVAIGLMDETADKLPSPQARLACNPALSGNEGGYDCNPLTLSRQGAVLVGRVEGVEGGRLRFGADVPENLAKGREFAAQIVGRIDAHLKAHGSDAPPSDLSAELPDPPGEPVRELDVSELGSIVWASGYRPDYGWIELPLFDELGWPVHERGVTAAPGLYFVGVHWLWKRKSALFLGVGEDAEHVVEHLVANR
jgi:putative flavoprotein involved in K+ transport